MAKRYRWTDVVDMNGTGTTDSFIPVVNRPKPPAPPRCTGVSGGVEGAPAGKPKEGANHSTTTTEPVKVYVRVRPLIPPEVEAGDTCMAGMATTTSPLGEEGVAVKTDQTTVGGFAGVLGPEADNTAVFERVFLPCLDTVVAGGTASLFCYGYTGSGKSHTVLGSQGQEGMYRQAAAGLLDKLRAAHPDEELFLLATACEIYSDAVFDLLGKDKVPGSLRKDAEGNLHVNGATVSRELGETLPEFKNLGGKGEGEHATLVTRNGLRNTKVTNVDDLEVFSNTALQRRAVGTSTEHEASSRSHAIIRMEVVSEKVYQAREAVEEALAFLPPILSGFDNVQRWNLTKLVDVSTADHKEGTVSLMQYPGGAEEWNKVRDELVVRAKQLEEAAAPVFKRVEEAYRRLEEVQDQPGIGGALFMIDLAGADYDDRDLGANTTAQQRKESIEINKSLLALKECFRSISGQSGATAKTCFRGSKLTRLLEESLLPGTTSLRSGQPTASVMVVNVAPTARIAKRTLNVLRYGQIFSTGKKMAASGLKERTGFAAHRKKLMAEAQKKKEGEERAVDEENKEN